MFFICFLLCIFFKTCLIFVNSVKRLWALLWLRGLLYIYVLRRIKKQETASKHKLLLILRSLNNPVLESGLCDNQLMHFRRACHMSMYYKLNLKLNSATRFPLHSQRSIIPLLQMTLLVKRSYNVCFLIRISSCSLHALNQGKKSCP